MNEAKVYTKNYWMTNEKGHLVSCFEGDPWVECRIRPFGVNYFAEITVTRGDPKDKAAVASANYAISKITCALNEAFGAGREYQKMMIRKELGLL